MVVYMICLFTRHVRQCCADRILDGTKRYICFQCSPDLLWDCLIAVKNWHPESVLPKINHSNETQELQVTLCENCLNFATQEQNWGKSSDKLKSGWEIGGKIQIPFIGLKVWIGVKKILWWETMGSQLRVVIVKCVEYFSN